MKFKFSRETIQEVLEIWKPYLFQMQLRVISAECQFNFNMLVLV